MHKDIYKIFRPEEWSVFEERGIFAGSVDDLRDGFIHLSTEGQLDGTLRKHFAHDDELVLAVIDEAVITAHLKWEHSRGGDLFPHLYAELPLTAVRGKTHIVRSADVFPPIESIVKTL